ncbi:FtsX-like permease family protein [Frateuria sp. Soil773]|uniref:ABC transporter permease n=1 Tax=Frateuria sp. Soil773 TaxID=1736407 RepID=UPI001F2D999A|nr:FtsX-like permease family protein [Frateuria sp. Soil773]
MAVLVNVIHLTVRHMREVSLPNGIDETALLVARIGGGNPADNADAARSALSRIRALPQVAAAAPTNATPLSEANFVASFSTVPQNHDTDTVSASSYFGLEGFARALDLRVIAGRPLQHDDYVGADLDLFTPTGDAVLVTKSLAEQLWPGGHAAGALLYGPQRAYHVVGVIDDILRPSMDAANPFAAVVFPLGAVTAVNAPFVSQFAIRLKAPGCVEADACEKLIASIDSILRTEYATAEKVSVDSFAHMRRAYFSAETTTAWTLLLAAILTMVFTGLGIFGLTSFWVQQRRKQVGVMRALGASRTAVFGYFLGQNAVLTAAGVVLGGGLAVSANHALLVYRSGTALPFQYILYGALAVFALSLLATLFPSVLATRVSPASAMRGR